MNQSPATHPPHPSLTRRSRRWLRPLLPLVMLTAVGGGLALVAVRATEPPALPETDASATRDGIACVVLNGNGTERGLQAGRLLGERLGPILRLTRLQRSFHLTATRRSALAAGLNPDHRAELDALAQATGADPEALYDANLALDTQCTVLLTGADGQGPVRLARNMDFFPASVLGPGTVVTLWRTPGKHALAGIGWPGYAGVISGMNDAGLCATVLKNGRWHGDTGTPLPFRVRDVLETAGSVEDAIAAFARSPVASDHFVVFADARHATVLWYDGAFHRRDPVGGVLTCSNGAPDAAGDQHDERTLALCALRDEGRIASETALKEALTSVYLRGINAQAMLFRPERRELDLALARPWHPAAKQEYVRLALGRCLDSGDLTALTSQPMGSVAALPHHQ